MKWAIYRGTGKDKGKPLHESITQYDGKGDVVYQDTFEYVGKWMGECYLTVSIKSPYPIDFQIGDYIEYRGEKFTINYDPTVIKKARRGTYGEGFVYDSIKFNSYSNELTMMLFHDWVLNDNKVHYTSLPTFSFYAKDVDDLVDRLQACADRWCKDNNRDRSEYWMFYTLANNTQGTKDKGQYQTTYERTVQRAQDISKDPSFLSAVQAEWTKTYGGPSDYKDSRDDERYDRNISISNNTVWDGLQKVKTEFGLNFIIRGRNVYIGTVGIPTSHLFEYGKGKGLYEVDKTADTDQKVVTRLHAYGSDQNMPTRYYAEVTSEAFSTIKEIKENDPDYSFVRFTLDLPYASRYFTNAMSQYGSNIYAVGIKVGDILVNARVEGSNDNGDIEIYSECLHSSTDDDDNTDFANFSQFKSAIAVGAKMFFTKGVDRSSFPISNIGFEDGVKALPDNMAVNSLMLPGFPLYSLADLCKSVYDSASNSTNYYIKKKPSGTDDEYVLFHTEIGKHLVTFSDDRHDPYIVSQNAASLGYRDGDISCTESNDDNGLEAVYPSIERVTVSDAGIGSGTTRLDVIDSADTIDDNGVYDKEGVTVPSFHVTLPKLGFDLRQAAKDANSNGEFKLSMKDGFCGGREFTAKVESVDASTGKITLRVQRSYDDSLFLWFPYSYAKSVQTVGAGMANAYQILSGDHFVLTGINVSDVNYVWTASVRLLRKAIHWLCKNDYTRYVYSPKIDEIFMARQDLEAKSDTSGKTVSIHDTLKEGDILLFDDDDLLISGSVYIDQLTIKENGNNGIPTYDVTLRNEVNVGTLQRIQNKVDSVANDIRTGNIGGNVGLTPSQVDPLVKTYGDKYFLSKTHDDETAHKLTMGEAEVKGDLKLGADGSYSISKEGIATLAGAVAEYLKSSDFHAGTGIGFDGQGYGITKDEKGKYTLEIDNLIARMKMIVADLEVHEMSFIGGTVVMSTCGNRVDRVEALDANGETIAKADSNNPTLTIPNGKTAEKFRCYFLASDGDRQIKNEWTVGQLARAKTNNIAAPGNYANYQNRDYWRLVVGVSSTPVTKEGKDYHYIDLSNSTSKDITLADAAGTTRHVTLGGVSETLNSLPFAGDNVIGLGHCFPEEEKRQNIAILSVLQGGWVIYKGINHYDLPHDNIVNKFGIDEAIITTDHLILRPYAAPKETQTVAVVRGAYSDTATYGHNDLVTYDGQTWIASGVAIGKTITGEKPSATSPYWSLAAAKGIQGEKGDTGAQGDGYAVVFLLNNVPIDSLNFDDVKASDGSVLEADFYNNGVAANVANASITCYDQDGNVLGSPITSDNTDNIIVDGGSLYLSKDCKYITVVAKDKDGRLLVSKSLGMVRNGTDGTEPVSLILYLSDGAYTWRQGQGKIATIAAAVTMGNYDITDAQDASQFIWTRESSSTQGDSDWNSQHTFGSKTLEVSEGDMYGNITSFVCTLHKSTGEVYTMAKKDFTL